MEEDKTLKIKGKNLVRKKMPKIYEDQTTLESFTESDLELFVKLYRTYLEKKVQKLPAKSIKTPYA